MKTASVVFAVLFVILVPLVSLLTDVQLVAYDRDYYRAEYDKYGIPEHIGMNMDNLMEATEQLLLYLDNKRDDLNFKASFNYGEEEFFSPRDKLHMIDVRGLFVKGRLFRDISLIYIAVFIMLLLRKKPFRNQLRKLARHGVAVSAAGIAPVIVLIILMKIDFYRYFTVFHEIFFTNDLWLLDPAADRLINIFPQDFFTDMAFSISYLYIAEMAAILICSLIALKLVKSN
ncbi:MAG: TIGR01906 family membrane protein [Clostridia bacterium]|jgi:integral membrane protein (TIGR01906 family)|nr:TIGR01906 family membrane protein [Clostridia bacterium]